MADIHIERQHGMSLAQARKAAFKWAEQAEEKFDMDCTYLEGSTLDEVSFKRSGVTGTLTVSKDAFELHAKLGFLLGAFKDKIEGEIVKNLDELIAKGAKAPKAAAPAAPAAKKTAVKKPAVKKA
jgi:putative polyhydroxyalkanoate system protein